MSIFKNAVDSIAVGLEDYKSSDQRRIVSCTRNVFAGILLLFKHKLCLLSAPNSDEVLIKQRILPNIGESNTINWIGKGKKTVDVQGIKERFGALNIEVEWKRFDKINNFRNDIEHYYSNLEHEAVKSLISNSFIIIRDFISTHLEQDPKDVLGDTSWSILIEVNEVYEKEKAECNATLEKLTYYCDEILDSIKEFTCIDCGSGLIQAIQISGDALKSAYECKSCGSIFTYETISNLAVTEYYFHDTYLSYTNGGETPITDCPYCCMGAYIVDKKICSTCGFTAEHICQCCGTNIIPEELSDGFMCGYCTHKMNKDN